MKRKGRPRNYDSTSAINNITELFWKKGYTSTSMDDLVNSTQMNKPSLYAAFGNKFAMYEKAIEHFNGIAGKRYQDALTYQGGGDTIKQCLQRYYAVGIDMYLGADGHIGCMVLSTAAAEVDIPEIQHHLMSVINAQTEQVTEALEQAVNRGELMSQVNTHITAQLLTAILHSISLRARAGESREELTAIVEASIDSFLQPLLVA